jgi:hypothetical protein
MGRGTMSKWIDADALIESIKNTADLGGWIGEALYQIKQVAIKYIDSAPSIDIEPKRGEWITHDDEWGIDEECSVCKVHTLFKFDYCPHCGAKMGEREGE